MRYNIYLAVEYNHNECKIGITSNPKKRLVTLQTSRPLLQMAYVKCATNFDKAKAIETELHSRFEELHIALEWFRYTERIERYFAHEFAKYEADKELPKASKARKSKKVTYGDTNTGHIIKTTWWGELIPHKG